MSLLKERELKLHPNIISCEALNINDKYFVVMPKYPAALVNLPKFNVETLIRFWTQISSALIFFHDLGFAHMDVKPANILISTEGDFILADLGCLAPFNEHTGCTKEYLPRELWKVYGPPPSSDYVDWWMIAMVIYHRACDEKLTFPVSPTMRTVLDAIRRPESIVPESIQKELFDKIVRNDISWRNR